ncbi:probable serine/threonine-protein kinase DDB_G0282963 isoform X2 [Macadamia integrifolia]|uniref:probable serine/threonine-protein kinase DDB_G0282963 isoform X2 n=1 Tax=Macadamia integrifolia TaxID=60698 RepID=UPI001C4EADB1|nr:probable serine/threonine-protein kinase DDB_G0282963 isoform X2 [Macadamia integrifolia]
MEREVVKNLPHRGEGLCGAPTESTSTDILLQWGNRKRLRCMKFQVKDGSSDKTTVRVDRRVVRTDKDPSTSTAAATTANDNNNDLNLRRHPPSTSPHRILRSSETLCAMRGQTNGMRSSSSPETVGGGGGEEKALAKRGSNHHHNHHHHHHNHNGNRNGGVGGASPSSETAQDSKKGGGGGEGSPSGSEAIQVWPPKFVIALTNKEKEEDFMAIKGSKLPQRPKKRAKFIQRTLNVPGVPGVMVVRSNPGTVRG